MKRHVQSTGIRQWAGEDLLELQSEPLKAIDSFFAQYGNSVVKGCEISKNSDGSYCMDAGLVALEGIDAEGEETFKVVPFSGISETTLPVYLTLTYSVVERKYVNGHSKPIAYDYHATLSTIPPEKGSYLELSQDHFPRFTDVIQDPEHRFFTDMEREMLNQHDLDIERIDRKDQEQDNRLTGHDEDVIRIDKKDQEQDGRLTGHDADVIRIDKKDQEQDGRLTGHDEDVIRIDKKDQEQDGRLTGHDADVIRIDKKDQEQDGRLDDHDADAIRIDKKDQEQDGRLDDHDADVIRIDKKDQEQDDRLDEHDADVIRIDKKDKEQDGRLDDHDEDVIRIDKKDQEQDGRLTGHDADVIRIDKKDQEQDDKLDNHDADVIRIDKKDQEQDGRLDDHDADVIRIDKKDQEQDGKLKDQELLFAEHTKGENKSSLNLYKMAIDTTGHIQNVTTVVKKDITDLGIPPQDTTYTVATTTANGLMSSTDKTKLNGIAEGANKYTHPAYTARAAGFNKVTVDATGHVTGVTAVTKKDITDLDIPAQDTTYTVATPTANGLMSSTDKTKLNGIVEGANKYTHPTHTARSAGLYKVTVDTAGHISAATAVTKKDITDLDIPAQDTTYAVATTTTNGLMSSTDKTKLNGMAEGANKYTHPAYTARAAGFNKVTVDATGHVTGVTAVTKKDITDLGIPATDYSHPTYTTHNTGLYKVAIDSTGHVSAATAVTKKDITDLQIPGQDTTYNVATTTANGLMSSTDKTKLNGIAEGANKYTHPAYTARTAGFNKVTVDATGHVTGVTAVTKKDITDLQIPAQDTTYTVATTTANGLMSSEDKVKLNNAIVPTDIYKTNSLSNLPTNKYNIYREYTTSELADAISFATTPPEGFECIISIKNSQTNIFVLQAIPNGSNWLGDTGRMSIAPGAIEEISIRYIGGYYLSKATSIFGLIG